MARRMAIVLIAAALGLLPIVPTLGAAGERAAGTLIDSTGATIGRVELTQEANAVRVVVRLDGDQVVKAGNHGIHFHGVGKCDTPDFMTAAAHYNPTSKQHGAKNPQGPHIGDLPNLPVDNTTRNQNGAGYTAVTTTSAITLSAGPASLFDADGTALIIHANPDDEVTDPTGNSGGRIACAVITQQPNLPNTGLGGMATAENARGLVAGLVLGTLLALAAANLRLRRARRA